MEMITMSPWGAPTAAPRRRRHSGPWQTVEAPHSAVPVAVREARSRLGAQLTWRPGRAVSDVNEHAVNQSVTSLINNAIWGPAAVSLQLG
jgi:hypothetical protein